MMETRDGILTTMVCVLGVRSTMNNFTACLDLQTPFFASNQDGGSMCHSYHLDCCVGNSINHRVGKSATKIFPACARECCGQRVGLLRMALTASSRAVMKAAAATGLRLAYQL